MLKQKVKSVELNSFNGSIITKEIDIRKELPHFNVNETTPNIKAARVIVTSLPSPDNNIRFKKGIIVFYISGKSIRINGNLILNVKDIITYID